jgi:hypothetical protein
MGEWTHFAGKVRIHKSERVSVEEVVKNTLSDEYSLDISTTDKGDHWEHTVDAEVALGAYEFIKCHHKFLENLKPLRNGVDLTVELRFIR